MNKRITRELPTPTTTGKTDEFISESGIRVTVTSPEHIPETIRQQKINRLYDILSGENRKKSAE